MASSLASNADTLQDTHPTTPEPVTRSTCPFVFKNPRHDRAKACDFVNYKHLDKEHVTKQRQRLGLARVPTIWEELSASPLRYPTRCLFHLLRRLTLARSPPLHDAPITIVCLADTRGRQPDVPRGHVLLHVGSLTRTGTREELQAQIDWLDSLPHRKKFVIAGQNDHFLAPWDQRRRSPEDPLSPGKYNEKATKDGGNDTRSSIEEDSNGKRVANKASNDEAIEGGHKEKAVSSDCTKDQVASEIDSNGEAVVSEDGSEKDAKDEGSSTDSISSGDITVSGPDWPITERDVKEAEQWAAAKEDRKGKQPVRANVGAIAEKETTPDKARMDSGASVHHGISAKQAANTTQGQGAKHDTSKQQEPHTDQGNNTKRRPSEQDTGSELD